jgi:hypothetical protein
MISLLSFLEMKLKLVKLRVQLYGYCIIKKWQ